jgi:DNA-binding response OmpR family regulator
MINVADILQARILVVDDDRDAADTIVLTLRSWGYDHVEACTDPELVPGLHRDKPYDLIVLDLVMPGMHGFQVMENLKAFERDGYLPVLAITGDGTQRLTALRLGARDVMRKPVDLDELQLRVRNQLEVRLLYKQLEAENRGMTLPLDEDAG